MAHVQIHGTSTIKTFQLWEWVMHVWQWKQVAFDPLVQLPEIGNESHFTVLLGSDEGWMTPLGVINFLAHAALN